MIPQFAIHAREPWSIESGRFRDALGVLSAARPPRKPIYKDDGEGFDVADDWSLAAQHNLARLMIQSVGNNTAVLQVRGIILKDCPFWCWECGFATSLTLLDAAIEMVAKEGYQGLVLDFNSPGGSCLGLYETAAKIKSLRGRGIHTTAFTSVMCASAAYYIASACQEIFASPTAIVGSIGTYSVFTDFSAAAEMSGLKFEVFVARAAPLKASGEAGSLTDAQREDMQRHVDEADDMFQAQVKSGRRGINLATVSTGAWWYAKSAPDRMVDDASVFHSLNDLLGVIAP